MLKKALYSVLTILIATAAVFGVSILFLTVMQHTLPISAEVTSSQISSRPISSAISTSSYSSSSAVNESSLSEQPLLQEEWPLILVNDEHLLPEDYKLELAQVQNVMVDSRIASLLAEMIAAGEKDGVHLVLSSAYRSPQRQSQLFEQAVNENKNEGMDSSEAEAVAANSIARPGSSEHSTGLAIDFNGVSEDFDTTPEYLWLMKHAEDYGFILRYREEKESITGIRFEPWHFRYVGSEHARKMNRLGLCLEEYVSGLSTFSSR